MNERMDSVKESIFCLLWRSIGVLLKALLEIFKWRGIVKNRKRFFIKNVDFFIKKS